MTEVADKYISASGRTRHYDQSELAGDVRDAACFLCWAEESGAMFGGVTAKDALGAMCRAMDIDPRRLRKAIMEQY